MSRSGKKEPRDDDFYLRVMEEAAGRMGLNVSYRLLEDDDVNISSGMCRLSGEKLLIIDKRLNAGARWKTIAKVLRSMDTDDVYLPPLARDILESA